MTRLFIACALTTFAFSCASAAELTPGSGYSIHLAAFDCIVYYTVEQDGYRVVATMASGADAAPIRVISTLTSGQSLVLSLPQSAGQPSIDFEIVRNGDELVVNDIIPTAVVDAVSEALAPAWER